MSNPLPVFLEYNIKIPMQLIFNAPMIPYTPTKIFCTSFATTYIESSLECIFLDTVLKAALGRIDFPADYSYDNVLDWLKRRNLIDEGDTKSILVFHPESSGIVGNKENLNLEGFIDFNEGADPNGAGQVRINAVLLFKKTEKRIVTQLFKNLLRGLDHNNYGSGMFYTLQISQQAVLRLFKKIVVQDIKTEACPLVF